MKIKTLDGYKSFLGIRRLKKKQELFKVVTYSGKELLCNFGHSFVIDGKETFLYELTPGLSSLDTENGKDLVIIIESTGKKDWVYDFIEVENLDHSYLTNDINSHNCQFMGSTVTLIDSDYILKKLKSITPEFTPDDFTCVWERVQPGHKYLLSIDTAAGVGSDFSVMNVFDITYYPNKPAKQVSIWRCNTKTPPSFAELVLDSANYWNDAYIIGEINGLSNEVLNRLVIDNEYENVYYDYENDAYGVYSHRTSKKTGCMLFKEELESDRMELVDDNTINELGYFEEVSPGVYKAKAGRNFHDDCIITCIWAAWFLKSRYFEDERDTWGESRNYQLEEERMIESQYEEETGIEAFLQRDTEMHDDWLNKDEMGFSQ